VEELGSLPLRKLVSQSVC